jgi:DNA-binding MarR family transcriptional regulator
MIMMCNTLFMSDTHRGRQLSVAFLLSQVGSLAAREFSKLLEPLKFSPPDAGILRLLNRSPGISQQELARRLDMHASRLVAVIDSLEQRDLVQREANPADRRLYSLRLTKHGTEALSAIGRIAQEHNEKICVGLNSAERETLGALLERIALAHGLESGIHPGYREMGRDTTRAKWRIPDMPK